MIEVCGQVGNEFPAQCDGCGHTMVDGEYFIGGIESCCGSGCTRNLCARCINAGAELLRLRDGMHAGRVITRIMDDGVKTKDGAA